MPGKNAHLDSPVPGSFEAATVRANVIDQCVSDVFRSATEIVDDALTDVLAKDYAGPCTAFANPDHLARYGNRARQRLRPQDPTTLDFEYDNEFEGHDFLKSDIRRKTQRHLIFATEEGLSLLSKSKTWYVDGTFKVVHEPFTQLFWYPCFYSERQLYQASSTCILFNVKSSY